jgi:hypothetical protein
MGRDGNSLTIGRNAARGIGASGAAITFLNSEDGEAHLGTPNLE